PSSFRFLPCPLRNPSPSPTSSSSDPTPQAIPNMVRNDRSLCAHKVATDCLTMSANICIRNFPLPPGRQQGATPVGGLNFPPGISSYYVFPRCQVPQGSGKGLQLLDHTVIDRDTSGAISSRSSPNPRRDLLVRDSAQMKNPAAAGFRYRNPFSMNAR